MNGELLRIVDAIHRDKAIDKETILEGIEQALTAAARKRYDLSETALVKIDRKTGSIVTEGTEQEIDPTELGRIAAQTAKQVILQKIREAEKTAIVSDFEAKKKDILTGTVLRFEGPNMIISAGKVEALLPKSEQVPGESYKVGDRIRVLVHEVRKKGPKVVVVISRAQGDFVRKLFELEVPEIAEKIVEIKAIAREAGHRTKIAVHSNNAKVDSVGACVGVRGARIRNVVEEINGEKVDIIRWGEAPDGFIRNALKPAEVEGISLDEGNRRARVQVAREQLSLAIGRGGQNVRLASRLTHWDIDIMAPEEEPKPAADPASPAETKAGEAGDVVPATPTDGAAVATPGALAEGAAPSPSTADAPAVDAAAGHPATPAVDTATPASGAAGPPAESGTPTPASAPEAEAPREPAPAAAPPIPADAPSSTSPQADPREAAGNPQGSPLASPMSSHPDSPAEKTE
ncbi:MAG: transcription termination/antitermination protein NusA [Planctomycetes bacterium]|nr:transcription termination/antitermination protein NusA [Planctomycetota bacterium]